MASSAPDALTPRAREIVAAARQILEQSGPEGLSMRAIAGRLGIRAPSLYKHVPDKEALEVALISDGLGELAGVFEGAVTGSSDPLSSLAAAYRGWALDHPHLYRLMMDRPLPRERLAPGLEDRAAGVLVAAVDGDADAARAAFAFAHGMVMLELNDRFPPDADLTAAWRRGIESFRPPAAAVSPGAVRRRERLDRGHGPDPVAGHEGQATAVARVAPLRELDVVAEVDRFAVVELGPVRHARGSPLPGRACPRPPASRRRC